MCRYQLLFEEDAQHFLASPLVLVRKESLCWSSEGVRFGLRAYTLNSKPCKQSKTRI